MNMTPQIQKALAKAQLSFLKRISPGRRLNCLIELRQAAISEIEEWAETVGVLDSLIEKQAEAIDRQRAIDRMRPRATGPH